LVNEVFQGWHDANYKKEVVEMMGKSNISYRAQEGCKKLDAFVVDSEEKKEG
jgi:hypothetical protein